MNPITETLQNARDLIYDPENWIKHEFARNMFDHQVNPRHPAACKFCLMGAVINGSMGTGGSNNTERTINFLRDVARRHGYRAHRAMALWNDDPDVTHATVMALLDKAIEEAKEYD